MRDRRPHAFARAPSRVAVELRAAWSSRARPRRSRPRARVASRGSRVAECNEITPADVAQKYVPLVVDGHGVGLMRPAFAADLANEDVRGRLRVVLDGPRGLRERKSRRRRRRTPHPRRDRAAPRRRPRRVAGDRDARDPRREVSRVTRNKRGPPPWRRDGASARRRRRDRAPTSSSPVNSRYGEPPRCWSSARRAPLLGIRAYGVHVNGYVCQDTHKPFAPSRTVGRAAERRAQRRFRMRWTTSWRGACPRTWDPARARSRSARRRPAFP